MYVSVAISWYKSKGCTFLNSRLEAGIVRGPVVVSIVFTSAEGHEFARLVDGGPVACGPRPASLNCDEDTNSANFRV